MTLTAVKAINCTSCGAGLTVLGGGRVTTHICPYCGTELDATDNYRALKRFNDKPRPKTPFPIGTIGKIHGVDYTVIGVLEHVERWAGHTDAWLDHQLYSPTHGYAWLTLERGHCTFSRRYRRPVRWMSSRWVERASRRPMIHHDGERFLYYETSQSEIRYAEGEFSWQPRKADKTTSVSIMGRHDMLSFSETAGEREVERTTYLTAAEIVEGFGFDPGFNPDWVHPLEPFTAGPNAEFQKKVSMGCTVICLLLLGLLVGQPKNTVLDQIAVTRADLPVERTLHGLTAGDLVQVRLQGDGLNAWSELELEVSDPEDEVLFTTTRVVERYSGRDSDGSWSEGRNKATATFRAPRNGDYTLSIALDAEDNWPASGGASPRQWSTLWVTAQSGQVVWAWLVLAAVGFMLLAAWPWWRARRHHVARWRGSDWVDEDDD